MPPVYLIRCTKTYGYDCTLLILFIELVGLDFLVLGYARNVNGICNVDIYECESSPCLNNGTCNDLIGSYECDCAFGEWILKYIAYCFCTRLFHVVTTHQYSKYSRLSEFLDRNSAQIVSQVGFGPKVDKNFGFNSGLRRSFCLRCTKIKSKKLCNIAKFFRPNLTFGFFRARFGLQISFRVRAYIFGFGPKLVGPFTTLTLLSMCDLLKLFLISFRTNFVNVLLLLTITLAFYPISKTLLIH